MQVDDAVPRDRVDPRPTPIAPGVRFALVGAGLALVALHLWIASRLPDKGPFVLGDEGGYLGNATYLVHRYGHPVDGYFGGYSLLLVPAAILRSAPHAYYQAALATNAVLSFVTAALAFLLARELFPRVRVLGAALVAGAVVLEPYVFLGTHLAMSENALVPATLLTAWLMARHAGRPSTGLAVAGGVAASLAFWISPRGSLVVIAFGVAHAVAWLRKRERLRELAVIVGATAVSVVVSLAFNRWLRGHAKIPGVDSAKSLPPLLKASTWRDFIAGASGRLAYLSIATVGLAFVGLVATAWWIRRANAADHDEPSDAQLLVGIFASLAVLATMAVPAFTTPIARLDDLYFGRYPEGVAMPLVVVGGGWLLSWAPARRAAIARLAVAAGGAIALLMLFTRVLPRYPPITTEAAVNVLAVFSIRHELHLHGYQAPMLVGALAVTAALLLAIVDRRVALVAMLICSIVVAQTVYSDFLLPGSRARLADEGIAKTIGRLGAVGIGARCIAYEGDATGGWPLRNWVFLLPKWRFEEADAPAYSYCGALDVTIGVRPRGAGDWHPVGTEGFYVSSTVWIDMGSVPAAKRAQVAAVIEAARPST